MDANMRPYDFLPTAYCRLFSDFKVWVIFTSYTMIPAVEVVAEGAGANEAEAVLLGEVLDADDGVHVVGTHKCVRGYRLSVIS